MAYPALEGAQMERGIENGAWYSEKIAKKRPETVGAQKD
jgi:hypothetical protein